MAGRRLEPVFVEQRPIVFRAQAAESERLDVAIAHLAQAAQHFLQPRDRRRVGAETDVLGERPQLNRNLVDRNAAPRTIRCLGGRGACHAQAETHRQSGDNDATDDAPAAAQRLHGASLWLQVVGFGPSKAFGPAATPTEHNDTSWTKLEAVRMLFCCCQMSFAPSGTQVGSAVANVVEIRRPDLARRRRVDCRYRRAPESEALLPREFSTSRS